MLPDDSSEEDRQTLYKCNPVMAKAAGYTKTLQKEKEILATKRDLIAKEDVSAEDVSTLYSLSNPYPTTASFNAF